MRVRGDAFCGPAEIDEWEFFAAFAVDPVGASLAVEIRTK
jgi:hypothetical protein